AEVRDEFDRLGGYELDARIEQVVEGLELRSPGFDSPVRSLSGGNKTKLSLARLLLSGANILLLDEPTNYLDLASLLWLERFVTEGDRSYLIVSHDRRFLDRTISSIIELKPGTPGVRVWAGGYSEYDDSRLRERQKQFEAYRDQQAEIARIEADIRRTKDQARYTESGTQLDTARRYAKKVARKAKARERRLERQINDSERQVEKPEQLWGLDLDDLGREPIDDDRIVLDVQNLRAGYGGREVLHGASLSVFGRDRLVLLGANGSGKSTLLQCVTGALPYKGVVRITPNVRVGALSQEGDELPLDKTVFEAFRSSTTMYEDEARTYLHKFLFTSEDVFKPVRALSHGRRAKLALAILVLSDANFLILDEPTSHMDVPALEAVEEALAEYKGPLLLVSHDRYFIERVGVNRFEVMEDGVLRPVESMHQYENLGRHDEVSERDSYGD
ncbi:MAG: ABC-F family ATP-binding cassette domain-containing protein, partial [Chloroflexia bacterium]